MKRVLVWCLDHFGQLFGAAILVVLFVFFVRIAP